jgi:hypothetical membrane protein
MTTSRSAHGAGAAGVAIAATLYFGVAAVATHLVSPQYDFVRDYISDYAVGPNGWIYSSAFLASFVGCVALAVALWRGVPPPALSRVGAVLIALVGVAYAIDFFYPTDILPPGAPPATMTGKIHLAAALLSWILFVIAAPMISARLGRDEYYRRRRGALLVFGWLALPLLLILVAVVVAKAPVGGLAEKTFILDRNVWGLILAIAILRAPSTRAAP